MKKTMVLSLVALFCASAIAKTTIVNLTSASSSQNTIEWSFSEPLSDNLKIYNSGTRPIEILFQVYVDFPKGDTTVVPSDKVSANCNADSFLINGGSLVFCEIKPASQFTAYVSKAFWVNGARGSYRILNLPK